MSLLKNINIHTPRKSRRGIYICFITCFLLCQNILSQKDSLNKTRLHYFIAGESIAYAGTMTGLYFLWYDGYDHSSFHWFNDSKEWLQMDKAGHFYTSYYFNKAIYAGYRYGKIPERNSLILSTATGFVFMFGIEAFDGFSEKWGASVSDIVANSLGTGGFALQEFLWKEQKIIPKFSYHNTKYSKYRPDALGSNTIQSVLKDYNGQTYWLSFNLKSIAKIEKFPAWLNLAFGYSGDGMLGGDSNLWEGIPDNVPQFNRRREYYLSLDIDLSRINTKYKSVNTILHIMNTVKIPFPAVEYSHEKFVFKPLYF